MPRSCPALPPQGRGRSSPLIGLLRTSFSSPATEVSERPSKSSKPPIPTNQKLKQGGSPARHSCISVKLSQTQTSSVKLSQAHFFPVLESRPFSCSLPSLSTKRLAVGRRSAQIALLENARTQAQFAARLSRKE